MVRKEIILRLGNYKWEGAELGKRKGEMTKEVAERKSE